MTRCVRSGTELSWLKSFVCDVVRSPVGPRAEHLLGARARVSLRLRKWFVLPWEARLHLPVIASLSVAL